MYYISKKLMLPHSQILGRLNILGNGKTGTNLGLLKKEIFVKHLICLHINMIKSLQKHIKRQFLEKIPNVCKN